MNCSQLIEYDEAMADKKEELQALRDRVEILASTHTERPPRERLQPTTPGFWGGAVGEEAVEPVSHPGRSLGGSPSLATGGRTHTISGPKALIEHRIE